MDQNQIISGWKHKKLVTLLYGVFLGVARLLEETFVPYCLVLELFIF